MNGKREASDSNYGDDLWIKRVEIYKILHDDYKFVLDKEEYSKMLKEYDDYLKTNKERSTPLSDKQKKDYSSNVSFYSLIENEEKLKGKKIILKGEVGSVHLDQRDLYFNFYIDGNYYKDMFVFFKKDIVNRNIKNGDKIVCYIDYTGLTGAKNDNNTVTQIPEGWARYIEFK